jgi:superfamily II DNA or RNA helicase
MNNRVEYDLKPHNKQTIDKILEIYESSNKCCAIQATGTGKTYLILRLLEILNDNGDKKAIIFAPNHEIIDQTEQKIIRYMIKNTTLLTYHRLLRMEDDELKKIDAEFIVFDELHRAGAPTWGIKIYKLLEYNNKLKIFGASATPIRCSDGRDMSEVLFDGNRACNISLAEALVRKIIPVMPIYVTTLYTYEEFENRENKIKKNIVCEKERDSLLKSLKIAKDNLDKSYGVPQIIKKYVKNYNGKYIVFCRSKDHLNKMENIVYGWFKEAGYTGQIKMYPYYSNESSVKDNLRKFEEDSEEGLKLLFVIGMLNEGYHPQNIDGCILLRSTESNIIYYQQIGRVIDAGSTQQRLVLDLVNNFNSLKTFNLKDELTEKIQERKNGAFEECTSDFDITEFHIYDHVEDCINIFNEIDNKIYGNKYSYEQGIKYLRIYFETNNNTKVPYNYVTKEGFCLGEWCCKIRKIANGTWRGVENLTENQKRELISMGFQFDIIDENWNKMFALVQEYCKTKNISINDVTHSVVYKDKKIGQWIHNQLNNMRTGKYINSYKNGELLSVGFEVDREFYKWRKSFLELENYLKEKNININNIPKGTKGSFNYYDYILTCKKSYKNNTLNDKKFEILKNAGLNFQFKKNNDYLFEESIKEYLNNPLEKSSWLTIIKRKIKDCKMSEKESNLLMKYKIIDINNLVYSRTDPYIAVYKFGEYTGYMYESINDLSRKSKDDLGCNISSNAVSSFLTGRYPYNVIHNYQFKRIYSPDDLFYDINKPYLSEKDLNYLNNIFILKKIYPNKIKKKDKVDGCNIGMWLQSQKKYYKNNLIVDYRLDWFKENGVMSYLTT